MGSCILITCYGVWNAIGGLEAEPLSVLAIRLAVAIIGGSAFGTFVAGPVIADIVEWWTDRF